MGKTVLLKVTQRLFLQGMLDSIPLMIAAAPFAIVFGALAQTNGLSVGATLGMSAIVFAGASQFVAIALIGAGAAMPIIVLTVFVVNLRHMLYSISLMPHVSTLPQRIRIPVAFWLTDETYAVVSHRLKNGFHKGALKGVKNQSWCLQALYFGASIPFYLSWISFTAVGFFMGQQLPKLTEWGLDIAMIVAFVGIVVPILKNRAQWACAITAFFAALVTHAWPHQSGLLISSLVAIGVGVFLSNDSGSENKIGADR